jgi:hypothetical protein
MDFAGTGGMIKGEARASPFAVVARSIQILFQDQRLAYDTQFQKFQPGSVIG